MKNLKLLVIIAILLPFHLYALDKDTSTKQYFYSAKERLENMLSGKEKASYEEAIYQIENAWYADSLDHNIFKSFIDHQTDIVRSIIKTRTVKQIYTADLLKTAIQKQTEYEKALANYAVFSFITDTAYTIREGKISYVINQRPFTYSFTDPMGTNNWATTQVTNLLLTRQGNCFALASLFKIFSDRLNSDAKLCTAPGHIYIRHADEKGTFYNVELASKAFPGTGTIETLTYTTDEATKNKIAMRELDTKQSIALCLVYLAKGYEYKFGAVNNDFMLACAESALKYDESNLNAMLLKAEVLESRLTKDENIEQLQSTKDFKEYQLWVTHIYSLGYREMPYDMKNMMVKGWMKDTLIQLADKNNEPERYSRKSTYTPTRYASLSWGLFDEKIRTKRVERYGNTVFDTKTKKIVAFVKSDILFNQYTFDPVIFAWSVDPMAHKMPGWSPYAAFADNPIVNFDPDGAFPYTFHVRAFAPPDVFKPTDFHDDGRSYSTRTDVTSRIKQNFTIDPTARQYSGGHPTSDPTIWHGISKTAKDEGGISTPEFGTSSLGSATASTTTELSGSNPFFYGAAPNIKVSSAISVTENLKSHQLLVSINVSSKEFPATEAFVQDVTGRAIFLGGAAASGNPLDLSTRGEKGVINTNLTIGINDKGEFQNVTVGDKTYSIDEFNKMGTSQPSVDTQKK